MSGIGEIEVIFLLLLVFILLFGWMAKKLQTPYPIVMVVGGLLVAVLPGMPSVSLQPDLVFLVVLPPLLYAAAWTTSWRDFRYNIVTICLLAFGLVAFTVAAVAALAPLLFKGFDWRLGFVLGSVVAPTDAIAATAIARRVGLPSRIVDILEGESLINDATALLALQFGTDMVVNQSVPTLTHGLTTLVWLTAGGIGLGLAVAWVVEFIERRLDDGPLEITLSILVPYAAYLMAERVHASGVLAVVSCGLYLARRSVAFFSAPVRLQIWPVWQSLNFVLNGLVFVLVGLQFPAVRNSIRGVSLSTLVLDGLIFSGMLIALRLAWVYPASLFSWLVRARLLGQQYRRPSHRSVFVLGCAGMRGVISLAAAVALPAVIATGAPFPQRNAIVFLTFCAILVTLVVQGLSLPPLVRALGLAGSRGPDCEENEARRIMLKAAIDHLQGARERDTDTAHPVYDDLVRHYRQRLANVSPAGDEDGAGSEHEQFTNLSLEALRVERDAVIQLRDKGRISDEVLRRLERELDLTESRNS